MYDNSEKIEAAQYQFYVGEAPECKATIWDTGAALGYPGPASSRSEATLCDSLPQFAITESPAQARDAKLGQRQEKVLEELLLDEIGSGKISEDSMKDLRLLMKTANGGLRIQEVLASTNAKLRAAGSTKRLSLEQSGEISKDDDFQYYSETTSLILKDRNKKVQSEKLEEKLHFLPSYLIRQNKYNTKTWLK